MPHLTLPITPLGPIINILVGVTSLRRAQLVVAGQSVPLPVSVLLLVDTGANSTCIDTGVINALGLQPTGSTPVHSASTGSTPHQANTFDISLVFVHPQMHYGNDPLPVTEITLGSQHGIHGLFGRDVLRSCTLFYNGTADTFVLGF